MKNKPAFLIFLTLFSLTLSVVSCKKDSKETPVTKPSYYVQNWILGNMEYWYYWSSQIPANADTTMAPDPFFYSLLYSGTNGDHFSWIEADYTTLQNQLNGINKEAGYDFKLYLAAAGSTNLIGQVTYIKKGSPAETAGLKRGDIFPEINGTQMNTTNYKTLLNATSSSYTIRIQRFTAANTQAPEYDHIFTLNPVELAENPVLMDTTYTISGKKIGYMVYNFFSPGSGTSKPYDQEVDNVFAKFKSSGVNEVVLDFRFNGGGAISSAINLASLLVPAYDPNKIFVNFQYNSRVQSDIINEPSLGSAYLHQKFVSKVSNIGDNLNRLFVLTSGGTASASELIINGLRPYLPVITVGDTTYGKNVGSITITDTKNTTNTWGMQPIVLKLTNSVGFSDYSSGFAPDPANYDRDNYFLLKPLGDINEPLLAKAISVITSGGKKSVQLSPSMVRTEIKRANLQLNPYKTTMYVNPEMSPLKK
jgi:carboxyl-terminal processing protease